MVRRFSIAERRALHALADGYCENCGEPLPDGWHADHVNPWSCGGVTDVINGQASCPYCNWSKGANVMMTFNDLRPWQQDFVTAYVAYLAVDYLLVALPGGGKTKAALWTAKQWLDNARLKPRLIIHISPLRQLKRQWRKTAKKEVGLQFQITDFDGKVKTGMHGLCFTYSGMDSAAFNLRILCSKYEVMVIFDEPHHMSEEAAWGRSALEAFEHATKRLFMTGTPWRQDMDGMPFISGAHPDRGKRLSDGTYAADYTFDWPRALEEKPRAIRILSFHYFEDIVNCEDSDTQEIYSIDSATFSENPNTREKVAQDRWLTGAIRGSRMVAEMIETAHTKLMEIRQHKPDAGGLVVCETQQEAARIAKDVKRITGVRPHLFSRMMRSRMLPSKTSNATKEFGSSLCARYRRGSTFRD
jgi:superfamily II DNA or RNA helicase